MKTFVIGDIHGEYDKFINCLDHVKFDLDNDQLIQLGDVVDRGPKSFEVVDHLLKFKNLIPIRGNHDVCFLNYLRSGQQNVLWNQGGRETYESYYNNCDGDIEKFPIEHLLFFKNQLNYYVDENNICFVHAGFKPEYLIYEQPEISDLYWDRDLWNSALKAEESKTPLVTMNAFKMIYIGHTPTTYYNSKEPMRAANIINLDTGCGKGGLLTIYNLETGEFYQN